MSKKTLLRALAAALIVTMLSANAALAETACIMSDTAVYASPDASGKSYGTLKAGTMLELTGVRSGWALVKAGGYVGFVAAGDVAEVVAYKSMAVYMAEDADLMASFASSAVVKALSKDDAVKLYATAGDWAYIKAGSDKGFVRTSSLTANKPAAKPTATDDEDGGLSVYVAVDGAKVYKSYSTSSKVLGALPVNSVVTVVAVKDGWCRVTRDGYVGFMKKSALSATKIDVPTEARFTAYVSSESAKVYGSYSTSADVLGTLSLNAEVTVTAYTDSWCRVSAGGKVAYILKSDLSTAKTETNTGSGDSGSGAGSGSGSGSSGTSSATPAKGTAKEMDWWTSDIQTIFSVGTIVTVTDVATGIAWREKRVGGSNHADCQPVTAEDTAAMKAACGSWSWERRAVFVTINGVNYAASMNCMPHGSDSIPSNNFDGHHCIHFTNSRTHGTNRVCPLHQGAIKKAAAAEL